MRARRKKVYTTNDPEVLIVDYKDDATAGNGAKKEPFTTRALSIIKCQTS